MRTAQWLGALLGLAAAVLVLAGGRRLHAEAAHLTGYLAALGAAVAWAGYSVLNRRHAQVPAGAIVPACALVALLGALAHLLFEDSVAPTPAQWLWLLLMGLGPVGAELLPQGVISRLQFEPLVDEGESAASQHAAQGDDPDAEQLESRYRDPDRRMWQISAHRHVRSMVIVDPYTPDVVP